MREDINIEKLICDNCKNEVIHDRNQRYYGGHPFNDWVNVTINHYSIMREDSGNEIYHFCSKECIGKYFAVLPSTPTISTQGD